MDGICASDNSDSGSHTLPFNLPEYNGSFLCPWRSYYLQENQKLLYRESDWWQFQETVKLLEKHITCPVCLEIFNEPKILSCLHTYCKTCVGNLIQARANNGGDIHCPECRGIVPVSDNDASKFPTSFLVNSLIDTFKNLKKASDPSTLCENCGKDKVAAYCSECALHICASCVGCHKTMKVFAGHNVMNGGEVLSTKQLAANNIIKFLCSKHKMKQLELYCQSCEKLICLNCTIVDHKGHVFDFVESLAAVFKTEVHSAVGGIVGKEQSIQQAIVNVEKVKEELTQQGNGLAHSICDVFGQLESTLQKEKEALLQQTKHMVEKKIGFLSTQAEILLISQTAFKSLQRFIEETSKNSCDEEFVSIKSQITARIRELDDKYRDLALEPKIQATIKYQTSFCTTSAGHQISVAVQDSEVACTPVHVNVAMKSSLQDDEPMNETPHKKNDTQKEGDQTNIIQASPPDTGTQSQIACGSLAPDCTAPAPHVPAGTAPAVDVLDGPDSTMKIVQKKKGRNHSSNIPVSAPQPGTGAQFQIAQVNWKGKEDKAEECPLQEKSSVKEVSWLDRSSRDADVPRDSWKERRDDLPCEKPVIWRPRVVSLSSDNDGWRRGDGKISKERESDGGLYGSFSGDRDGDTNRPPKENVQTRERDGDSWRASRYKGCPKKQDGDVWRPSEDEEPPRKRDVGRVVGYRRRPRAEEREKESGDSWRPHPAIEEELEKDKGSTPKVSWRDMTMESFETDTSKSKESGDQGDDGWSVVKSSKWRVRV